MESVEVKELSFAYENTDTLILKNLNMQIQEGDFVCLLGQSGCGKSTLLRLLAGLEKPTTGEILIDGKPIKGASLERSVVFQDYGLFPWMTAGENIVLALKQKFPKQKKSELKAIAKEMLVNFKNCQYVNNSLQVYFTLENTSVFTSSKVFVLKYAQDATIAALSVQYFIGGAKTL